MAEPLFPIRPQGRETLDTVFVVEPYRHNGAWVFDDSTAGLVREPFVAGVTEMIDRHSSSVPDAEHGFGCCSRCTLLRGIRLRSAGSAPIPWRGIGIGADDAGDEGWLCPALLCYFPSPPRKIYVRAQPKQDALG